ncbi:MAG: hypothetical protein RLY97_1630 [Pseudomonadota bacterium]|jgi:16S rRNA (guanine527-N7)-methyltransferase
MIADEQGARIWLQNFSGYDVLAEERCAQFCTMLTDENNRQNLVSSASLNEIWRRHIADSAQLLCHVSRETIRSWLDLGAGAGFPGIIIAILQPQTEITLVESRSKRIAWLEHLRITLNLDNLQIIGSRLESIESRHYDVISARAFAPLDKLLTLSARFSTATTQFALPKGRMAAQELAALSSWQHRFHVEPSLTDPEAGIIIGQLHGKIGKQR